jgi:hypothetical protein
MCQKGTLYLFFIQTSHFRIERKKFVLTVQGSGPRTQSALAGTYTSHVWDGDGEARIRMAWWWPMPPCMGAANWPVPLANGLGHLSWPFGPTMN